MADIVRGRYRHFKGGVYIVLGTATHSETGEKLVIYHKAGCGLFVSDEEQKLWARPAKMWSETVFRHGSEKQRFELLNTIPTADVVERKKGHCIEQNYDVFCSECGVKLICCYIEEIDGETLLRVHPNFCPNCGADLRNEADNG